MTLTAKSFTDFETYKKDLQKTVRNTVTSPFTVFKVKFGNEERSLLVCGKDHAAILRAARKEFGPCLASCEGTFLNTVFQPMSGFFKPALLKDWGIDKITSIQVGELGNDDVIPSTGDTIEEFKDLISDAQDLLKTLTLPKWAEALNVRIQQAQKWLPTLGSADSNFAYPESFKKFVEPLPQRYAEALKALKESDHWLDICTKQAKTAQTVLDQEAKNEKPNQKNIDSATSLQERTVKAVKLIEKAKHTIQTMPDHMELGLQQLHSARQLFKGYTDFNADDTSAKSNDKDAKLQENIQASKGLSDLYAQYKKNTLAALASKKGMKDNEPKSKELLLDCLKLYKHLESQVFKEDLAAKLKAVDKSADKLIDARKPLIEKAIMTARNYVKAIDQVTDGGAFGGAGSTLLPLREALMHIQRELASLYTSKVLPKQK